MEKSRTSIHSTSNHSMKGLGRPARVKENAKKSFETPKPMQFIDDMDEMFREEDSVLPAKRFGPRPELTHQQTLELYNAFGTFDPRGRGLIDTRGFTLALRAMTYEPTFEEVDNLIEKVLGPDKKQVIDFKDFYKLMTAKMIGKDSKEDNLKAFRMFSDPETDSITLDILVGIAKELEADISTEELQEMIDFADTNKNGNVTFDEFTYILKRPKLE